MSDATPLCDKCFDRVRATPELDFDGSACKCGLHYCVRCVEHECSWCGVWFCDKCAPSEMSQKSGQCRECDAQDAEYAARRAAALSKSAEANERLPEKKKGKRRRRRSRRDPSVVHTHKRSASSKIRKVNTRL